MAIDWELDSSGTLLKRARLSEGMSRKALAERLNVSAQSIYNWEVGNNEPHGESLIAILDIFGEEAFDAESPSTQDDAESSLSSWLRSRREHLGLSRHELAQRAGVTYQTIRNIEIGATTSPQQATVSKLEEAIGEVLPEDVDEEVRESGDVGVEGVGSFTDFDPHVEDELPDVPGIYVFYDVSDRAVYVGESGDIRGRIRSGQSGHWDKFWYRSPIVDKAAYVQIEDQTLRRQIEAVMIKFLKSHAVINRKLVARPSDRD